MADTFYAPLKTAAVCRVMLGDEEIVEAAFAEFEKTSDYSQAEMNKVKESMYAPEIDLHPENTFAIEWCNLLREHLGLDPY